MSLPVKSLLITGGAGFVGANLALFFKRDWPDLRVMAFDNLKRRGGEMNLPRFKAHGVEFIHGDVRSPADLHDVPAFDLLIDAAAEPSVHAGIGSSPWPVFETNLVGSLHCYEAARRNNAAVLLLSSSRVYPIAALNALPFTETESRFRWTNETPIAGFSEHGIAESFPLAGPRSYYGASKLSAELILQEYAQYHGVPALINRCGVLTGPWQMGKVDQGVVALWVAGHFFRKSLRYIGYGGTGKQVRDMLHIEDFYELLVRQIERRADWQGQIFNVGGGNDVSASLLELTRICRQTTGQEVPLTPEPKTSSVDLRIYITDARHVRQAFAWQPQRSVERIVGDLYAWISARADELRPIFG